MAKKITGYVKLQVPAGAANPSPPIGPALGQRGLNIMEFCKAFNAKTAQMEKGTPIPVVITAYQDRSFTFEMKQPPVSFFLKKAAAKIGRSGSQDARQGHQVGKVTEAQIREIAEKKMADLNCDSVECRRGHDRGLRPVHGPRSRRLREGMMAQRRQAHPRRPRGHRAPSSSMRSTKRSSSSRTAPTAKFDETIEVAMNLGVDPRHADQMVRGVCNLPNGSGRTVRVAVFARGAKADEAKAAGADIVGAEDLVRDRQGGKIEFDRCIATPDMMPLVGRLGKVLGPRGLMPNPKVGTVTMDVKGAVAGRQGRRGRVPRREGRHRPCRHRQGLVRRRQARREHQGVRGCGGQGQARGRQGHLHPARRDLLDDGSGREGRAGERSDGLSLSIT